MNIAEKFNEKKRIEKQKEEAAKQERLQNLVNRITTALSNEETIKSIENYLMENGSVCITDFGCLCQRGDCEWQKGLKDMLQPVIQEWETKGVVVNPSLRLEIYVPGGISFYSAEKTIARLKEWNTSKK